MSDLVWMNNRRKVNDLIPFDKNPRRLTEEQKEHLKKSLEKFNLAEIPAIDLDSGDSTNAGDVALLMGGARHQ